MLDTNVSGFDLGILKAKILTSNNKQCIKTLTNEEIAKYIRYCNNLTREEKLPIVFKKINYIKSESFDNKDYLKKEVAKLSLLLKSIYFTKEEAANYWKYKESFYNTLGSLNEIITTI